jgi:hypothetical protein
MPNFLDKIRSLVKPQVLSPVERWQKKSKSCGFDLKIKEAALVALKAVSVGTGLTSLVVPTLALALPTGGLSLAIGSAIIAVAGVSASILGVYKTEKLRKYFDWTDYSDKATVKQDIERITNLDLEALANQSDSPVHRIKNLTKYGILSSKQASRMKGIFKSFVEARKYCQKLSYDNPRMFKAQNLQDPAFMAYNRGKEKLEAINKTWMQFQHDVSSDLPSIV